MPKARFGPTFTMFKRFFLTALCLAAAQAHAAEFVAVPDASKIEWQMVPDGKVYLRNLGQFNGGFMNCCYNYYIDPTTPLGKTQWATLLTKMTAGQKILIGVDLASQTGPVTYLGNW